MRSLILAGALGLAILGAALLRTPATSDAAPSGRVALPAVSAASSDCSGITPKALVLIDGEHNTVWTSLLGSTRAINRGLSLVVLGSYFTPPGAQRTLSLTANWYNPAGALVRTHTWTEIDYGSAFPASDTLPTGTLTPGSWRVDLLCDSGVFDTTTFTVPS